MAWAAGRLAPLRALERVGEDVRLGMLAAPEPQHPGIVVLAIGEETLARLPWRSPIHRGFLADLIIALKARQVAAIGLDVLVDQATDPALDARLAAAIDAPGPPVVLVAAGPDAGLSPTQARFHADFVLGRPHGDGGLLADPVDGVVRRAVAGRSFAAALAEAAGRPAIAGDGEIAWRTGPDAATPPFAVYPAEAAGFLPPAWLAGRVALIGVVLPDVDRHSTPPSRFSDGRGMAGVLVHAHVLAQLIDGRSDRLPPAWAGPALTLLAAAAGLGLAAVGLPAAALLLAVAVAILAWGAAILAGFRLGLPLLPFVAPSLALMLTALLGAARLGRSERALRLQVRAAFERYLAPTVVARMLRGPDALQRGSEWREVSVLFTDLAGFSALTEKLGPERLATALNPYLDGILAVVAEHGGTVDKIVGDAVHAFFGAPEPQSDHAARAVACALAVDAFAEAHRAASREAGIPLGETRIGIATGQAIVGNFGGTSRFDYTVYGDVINTAARLESANRQFGTRVCATAQALAAAGVEGWRPVGTVRLVGKNEAAEIVTPVRGDGAAYAAAFARLAAGDTDAARTMLRRILERDPQDGLSRFHLSRIERGEPGAALRLAEK